MRGARNVFYCEVTLSVRRHNRIAIIGDRPHAVTVISGNGPSRIDAKQLIEIRISVVIDGLKFVAGSLGQCRRYQKGANHRQVISWNKTSVFHFKSSL